MPIPTPTTDLFNRLCVFNMTQFGRSAEAIAKHLEIPVSEVERILSQARPRKTYWAFLSREAS